MSRVCRAAASIWGFLKADAEFLGMGFYSAWLSLCFYTTITFPSTPQASWLVDILWSCGALSFLASIIFFILIGPAAHESLTSRRMILVSAVAMIMGTVLTVVSGTLLPAGQEAVATVSMSAASQGSAAVGIVLAVLGTASSSFFSGFVVMQWADHSSRLSLPSVVYGAFGAMTVSAVMVSLVRALPMSLGLAAFVACPLLSAACLLKKPRRAFSSQGSESSGQGRGVFKRELGDGEASRAEGEAKPQAFSRRPVRVWRVAWRVFLPLGCLFVYALGGEIFRAICMVKFGQSVDAMGEGYIFSLGVSGVLFPVLVSLLNLEDCPERIMGRLLRPAIVIMAAAFAMLSFLDLSPSVAYAIFGLGFQCVRSVAWVIAIYLAQRHGLSPIRSVALAQAGPALAPVLYAILKPLFYAAFARISLDTSSFAMLFSLTMLVIALFVLNERDFQTVWGIMQVPAAGVAHPARCGTSVDDAGSRVTANANSSSEFSAATLAGASTVGPSVEKPVEDSVGDSLEAFGLTRREIEVARLLAKGRSLPFVEEQLHISHGTAQTHQRHIYEKMGVHSRQEFLSLVESCDARRESGGVQDAGQSQTR